MNSALAAISFQSPSFNLQPRPQQHLAPPQREIRGRWGARTRKPDFLLKPIQATLGPNATGGLNNTNRRGNTFPSSPLSNLIQEFYSSLNDKDNERLKKLLAPDCIIEDTAYYEPLDIKVLSPLHFLLYFSVSWFIPLHIYFERLMQAMGKNAKFVIDEISPGVEPTVAVMWHLGKIRYCEQGIGEGPITTRCTMGTINGSELFT